MDANSAIELALVDDKNRSLASFYPDFTYPIFGEQERIFGYKDLHLQLRMNQTDMRTLVLAEYGDKAADSDEVDPLDRLREYAPEDVYVDEASFIQDVSSDASPPGISIFSYQTTEGTFDVYKSDLSDERTRDIMSRVHLLVLFLIEGGSGIDLDDAKWECYFLYQTNPQRFIGFATVYPYYWFHPRISTHRRLRISQFLVLPPYRGRGYGAKLYEGLYRHLRSRREVVEITVEDPSERFDDLRDRCDLALLERDHVFDRLVAPVSPEWMHSTRQAYKLAPVCVMVTLLIIASAGAVYGDGLTATARQVGCSSIQGIPPPRQIKNLQPKQGRWRHGMTLMTRTCSHK